MNQTDQNGIGAVIEGLLGMNKVMEQSLTDLDRVEIQIIQEQLARIIHRNGYYVARQEEGGYMVDGQGGVYHPHSQRERLFNAITDLAGLEQTDCYGDQGHEQMGTTCLICYHTDVLKNPVSTDVEMINSTYGVVCRIAELEENLQYGQQNQGRRSRPWTAFNTPKPKEQLLNISYR